MLSRELAEEVALAFDGNLLRATFTAQTLNHLLLMLGFLEYSLPAYLSLGFKVFVRVDAITGELPNGGRIQTPTFPVAVPDPSHG